MVTLYIVDDNTEILGLYERLFTIFKQFTITGMARNGREAIDKYTKMDKKPDLILMDVNMPEIDGISAAVEIRKHDKNAKFMFVTSEDIYNLDLPPMLFDSSILNKPFNKDMLFSAIKEAVNKKCSLRKKPIARKHRYQYQVLHRLQCTLNEYSRLACINSL